MELTIGGNRVFAHTAGVDPTGADPLVLLIHGAGNDHSIWRYQTRWLAGTGRKVAAVDLPGHGRSDGPPLASVDAMADWIAEVAGALDARSVVVVGHSLGSLVALDFAARSEIATGVVLVATAESMAVHPELQRAADAREPLAADLIVGWSHTGRSRFGHHLDSGVWPAAATRRLLERAVDALGVDLRACAEWEDSHPGGVGVPTLVIIGSHDRMTPERWGHELADQITDARVVTVPGGSHVSVYDHPKVVNAAMSSWLDEVAPVRRSED